MHDGAAGLKLASEKRQGRKSRSVGQDGAAGLWAFEAGAGDRHDARRRATRSLRVVRALVEGVRGRLQRSHRALQRVAA